jgi:hypothetical protein
MDRRLHGRYAVPLILRWGYSECRLLLRPLATLDKKMGGSPPMNVLVEKEWGYYLSYNSIASQYN